MNRQARTRVVALAVIAILAVAAMIVQAVWHYVDVEHVAWWSGDGEPTPKRFTYVLLPEGPKVELFDEDGKAAGVYLERAITCTEAELTAGTMVTVFVKDRKYRVQTHQLAFALTSPEADRLVANWKAAVRSWGEAMGLRDVDAVRRDVGNNVLARIFHTGC
ncbi:MAG: hypothetical protein WC869_06435 [Phycisphaerae bacterium]|jgi:hypothetical protein